MGGFTDQSVADIRGAFDRRFRFFVTLSEDAETEHPATRRISTCWSSLAAMRMPLETAVGWPQRSSAFVRTPFALSSDWGTSAEEFNGVSSVGARRPIPHRPILQDTAFTPVLGA